MHMCQLQSGWNWWKKHSIMSMRISKSNLTENKNEHTAIVSMKSTSHREYSVNLPKSTTLGSRFRKCTCGFPNKEGIPCHHMVAVCKLGRIDGLSRSSIMPHWYTTAQWHNQFPKKSYIDTHQTLKSIKANSTPHDDLSYCPNWLGPQKKGRPKKEKCKKSIADYPLKKQKLIWLFLILLSNSYYF